MKMPMRVGIIGAGAAGLSAAYRLLQMGFAVEVFESAPFVGGQASTVQLSGETCRTRLSSRVQERRPSY